MRSIAFEVAGAHPKNTRADLGSFVTPTVQMKFPVQIFEISGPLQYK